MLQQTRRASELEAKGLQVDPADLDLKLATQKDALLRLEYRRLLRAAFYESLGRRPPSSPAHLPSYVRAVKKKWNLQFSNSARRLLANVEGFSSWEDAISAE